MASWRDPSGTRSLELDKTHNHATVVEPLPKAGLSGFGGLTAGPNAPGPDGGSPISGSHESCPLSVRRFVVRATIHSSQ